MGNEKKWHSKYDERKCDESWIGVAPASRRFVLASRQNSLVVFLQMAFAGSAGRDARRRQARTPVPPIHLLPLALAYSRLLPHFQEGREPKPPSNRCITLICGHISCNCFKMKALYKNQPFRQSNPVKVSQSGQKQFGVTKPVDTPANPRLIE